MVLHLGAVVKLNLSIALRGTILSPTCLLISYLVKLSLSTNWFLGTFDDTAQGVRFFLFQLSRIMFDHTTTDQENHSGLAGRWERAIRLFRRNMATRTAVDDGSNYHLLSMTALWNCPWTRDPGHHRAVQLFNMFFILLIFFRKPLVVVVMEVLFRIKFVENRIRIFRKLFGVLGEIMDFVNLWVLIDFGLVLVGGLTSLPPSKKMEFSALSLLQGDQIHILPSSFPFHSF